MNGQNVQEKINQMVETAGRVLLGKEREIRLGLVGILCRGHILIEDVPGVGKTTLVYLLCRLFGGSIGRIQFTNDMLPSDIIGTSVFDKKSGSFSFQKGPIFGQFILADELNRATPKTQSALLQSMEERRVSVDGKDYPMDDHFLIVATQNPFQQVGTYPLPESQLDRFFLGFELGPPEREDEKRLIQNGDNREVIESLNPVVTLKELGQWQEQIKEVKLSDAILDYIMDLLEKGRQEFEEGVLLSPRSGKNLALASKACAFMEGREFVLPEDVQVVAPAVFGHRLGAGGGMRFGGAKSTKLLKMVPLS